MLTTPPADFDLNRFYEGIYLFQTWEVFPGHVTAGGKDVAATLDALRFPHDLTGKRVLDIAPWNGFFSFECARRGAREVVSLGPEDPRESGFEQTRAVLELDNVRYVQGSVYNLDANSFGSFDIVLFLGLIYHLRHPLLALDRIHDVCGAQMFVDTPTIDTTIYDRTLTPEQREQMTAIGPVMHQLPLLYYTAGDETGDPYNWFMPNRAAFRTLVSSSGFDIVNEDADANGWCWMATTKGERRFVPDYEGFNPYSVRR